MKNLIITNESLENYYNEYLQNDVKFSANYGYNYFMCFYDSHQSIPEAAIVLGLEVKYCFKRAIHG